MIIYVTGAPGAGKTLWTIQQVKKLQEDWAKEKGGEIRPAFYWFPEASADVAPDLGWTRLKVASECHQCPQGAIIVIDEAWQPWPQAKPGKPPEEIELFATHRHRGHDYFIITQRPTSVHHFIRGLIGRHVHFERQFGFERSRKFEWQKLGDPSDNWSKREALKSEFRFPKDVYKLYKSSDMHTVRKEVPWKKLASIGVALLLCASSFIYALHLFKKQSHAETAKLEQKVDAQSAQVRQINAKLDRALEALTWSQQFQERVPGYPYSATFYDPVVRPVTFPKISGCSEVVINSVVHCTCDTQQGTHITSLTNQQCAFYVRNGWFDPAKDDKKEEPEMRQEQAPPGLVPGEAGGGGGPAERPPAAALLSSK